jgi:hypothetical protein
MTYLNREGRGTEMESALGRVCGGGGEEGIRREGDGALYIVH